MTSQIFRYLACLIITGCLVQADLLRAQPEEILLNHNEKSGYSHRNPVRFPHEEHMNDFDCLDCHHRYENKKNVLDPSELEEGNPTAKCTTCHKPESCCQLQSVFHSMCMGCHIRLQKSGRKSGPRLCNDCHPQKPVTVK